MHKAAETIKTNWLLFFIAVQPFLDMLSYFQTERTGASWTGALRLVMLAAACVIIFVQSGYKKNFVFALLPIAAYLLLHVINLCRIHEFNFGEDIKYFINVFQAPVITVLLIDHVKSKDYDPEKIKKTLALNFVVLALSILLAFVTNTYKPAYPDNGGYGVIGWFSSANTISMILAALSPWFLYMVSRSKKWYWYLLGGCVVFAILFSNGTKSCYGTMAAGYAVMLVLLTVSKKERGKWAKVLVSLLLLLASLFFYQYSPTHVRNGDVEENIDKNQQEVGSLIIHNEHSANDGMTIDFDHIDSNDRDLVRDILNTSYLYREIMDIHGEDAVVEEMKSRLSASALSDNRLRKMINARIEYKQADPLTKALGIGYSVIQKHSLDMENDLQALFYYYGYVGFALYLLPFLLVIIQSAILFIKKPKLIWDREFIILIFILALLLVGGEYSGAILRKANANVYLAIFLSLLVLKLEQIRYDAGGGEEVDRKKITFLLLHLGYGGIETATINTANALSSQYHVELISFYHLKDDQARNLDSGVTVHYLYEGGPNRDEFMAAVRRKNVLAIGREGIKAVDILLKKKRLIRKSIEQTDAFAVVSTRYDFSVLLSKYGREHTLKIAQEHHHHNNNKKYIRILSTRYQRIDYLLALTEGLGADYRKFLKNNHHTQVAVIPNMIDRIPQESSPLTQKNIICVGRLHEGKKVDELVEIFSGIKNKKSKFYIIGSGDEEDNIRRKVEKLDLEDRVIMPGYLPKNDQQAYLLDSAVCVMASVSEGLPMSLIEAMGYGIPCIAYETDNGVGDIIDDGRNGFIIKNRDRHAYIRAVDQLLDDDALRQRLGKNAKETACRFDKKHILERWYHILEH